MGNILIAYYSFSKMTKTLAEEIGRQTGGDIRELSPKKPYSFDYNTASKEARSEISRGFCPELEYGNESIENYDIIFIGSPNWFKTMAPPALSFLRKHDFSKKTLIPFCSHGGGGFGQMEEDMIKESKTYKSLQGYAGLNGGDFEEVRNWLKSIDLLD